MTDKQTQANHDTEQDHESTTDEEHELTQEQQDEQLDAETEKAIAELQQAIDQMDEQLKAHRTRNIDAMKQAELKALGYTAEQVERYQTHIEGETSEEIKASVLALRMDIPPPADNFGDPSLMNGAKVKPTTVDKGEVGRSAIRRVIDKIRL